MYYKYLQPYHSDFVYTASILRAQQYNFEPITNRDKVLHLASLYQFPEFKPRSNVKIAVTDAEAESQNNADITGLCLYNLNIDNIFNSFIEDSETVVENLNVSLARLRLSDELKLIMIDFEKDDDTNHHVDFVTAASNLRANNYNIEIVDRIKVFFTYFTIIMSIYRQNKLPEKLFQPWLLQLQQFLDQQLLSFIK